KDNLNPEEVKSYKFGDHVNINVLSDKDLGMCLVPEEDLGALTDDELLLKSSEDATLKVLSANVRGLAQAVYGNPNIFDKQLKELCLKPDLGEEFVQHVATNPKFMGQLAGKSYFGFKNETRRLAEQSVPSLVEVLGKYCKVAANTRVEIIDSHYNERERTGQEVRMPSNELQKVLESSSRARLEALETSPSLRKELTGLLKQLNGRLSPEDHKAIKEHNYKGLADQLGISVLKAEKISMICEKAESARHDLNCAKLYARVNKQTQTKAMAMAS
ncbi:BID domain-containing T4SS effector, partial [Bartonella sp. CB178]|uniref:BID domain-containing T4SS effector n=1 Tax=Bartonella sp. CB178 TaxID=3112255 RepID=UPI00300E61D5